MTQFVMRLFVVFGWALFLYAAVCAGVYIRGRMRRREYEEDFREWSRELR